MMLPAERRGTEAKPLQRLQIAEDALDINKVAEEVAASPSLLVRVQNMASFHPGGIHVGLADGSTKYINEQIDTTTFLRLGSMMDGQVLGEF